MVEKTSYEPGTPCWVDLGAPDVSAAAAFYADIFGWEVNDLGEEAGGYQLAMVRGQTVAGFGGQMNADVPPYWTTYIAVDDVEAAVSAVAAAGGQVLAPAMDVMESGRMAVFADPSGAPFNVWQAGSHLGSGMVNDPGSTCWFELNTRAPEVAKAFYGSVFAWTVVEEDMDGSTYHLIKASDGKTNIGGLMVIGDDMPAEIPENWTVYFEVADCDATVARTVELGGTVLVAAQDIPPGRFAILADPQGAWFSVMTSAPMPAAAANEG